MRNYLRACDKQGRDKKAGSGQGFFLRSRFFASDLLMLLMHGVAN